MPRIRLLFILASLLLSTSVSAQVFGGNPPSLRWHQLNTDTARIIFPAGLDSISQQVAGIVRRLSGTTLATIGPTQRKINIVLQNQSTIANGYVSLAPFRSEFQLTPEQNSFDLGSLPLQKLLAIHEYRHVQQYNNFRVGLSGFFYYLFGEGGQAFANSLAVPNWFWEGDAVYQETLISEQGRGRLPFFFNSYRSLWSGDKRYAWMKLRNGSLRDYVPDHYPLGYMLVAYGRERYGDSFWREVSHDAAAFHGLFYPLQSAVKRHAGISFNQFTSEALQFFRKAAQPSYGAGVSAADNFARSHRHFSADEEFPQFVGHDSLLYMRSSYKRIPAFVLRDLVTGRETRVGTRAVSLDNYFSFSSGRVVYSAYETDPRWGWRDYSVIRIFDPATGDDRRITKQSRYFSPDISSDGKRIVAVQEGTDGSCALHLLEARDGSVLCRLPNPDGLFYTYPKFLGTAEIVTAVRNRKGEMSLALVDAGSGQTGDHEPKEGSIRYLLPFSFQTIGFPSVSGDTIWFTASSGHEDRNYGFTGGRLFRVLAPHGESSTGQYEFHSGGDGWYTWNNFTAVGFWADTTHNLRLQPIAEDEWMRGLSVGGIDSLKHGPSGLLDHIEPTHYAASNYPITSHLLNFHSWRPYVNDPDYQLSLVSDNILNTFETQIFAGYNRNEQYKQLGVSAVYGGLYPFLDAGWDYTFGRNALYRNDTSVYWNEMEARAGFSIPLSWTRYKGFTSLQFGSDIVYNQRYFTGLFKDSFNSRGFAYIDPYVSLIHQSQQARQQVAPRWAQVLSLSYSTAVTSLTAHQFLASGFLYLPGVAWTHSLVLSGAFQQRDTLTSARFTNSFPFSRGYTAENFYRMWKASANYQLPLVYPDWGFGDILYFLRIRANLYYDYTHAMDFYKGNPESGNFRSAGAEIFFDTKWWNQLSLSFGIRYSRLFDTDPGGRGPDQWELILPLNILSQGYSGRAVRAVN